MTMQMVLGFKAFGFKGLGSQGLRLQLPSLGFNPKP